MDDNKNQECFFCKDIVKSVIRFSCEHQICARCIIQKFFCYQINQLNNVNQLEIKCNCPQDGNLLLNLQQFIDLFVDYKHDIDPDILKCKVHFTVKDIYCKECNYLTCSNCLQTNEDDPHKKHRVEQKPIFVKRLSNYLHSFKMSLMPQEVFEATLSDQSAKFEKNATLSYKATMGNLESLIKSLQDIQKNYQESYVKLINKGVFNLKLVKLLYNQFYADLLEIDQTDINTLRYLNNIGFVFKKIEAVHNQEVDRIVSDLKNRVEEIKRVTEPLRITFEYDEVPRSFRCPTIVSKAHPELIKTVIQLQDETILTGGNDSTIKIWKDNGTEYVNTSIIKKLVGQRINALLEISDNRIISCAESEGNVKIWKQNANSYTIQQSLSHHETNVTCLAKFPDEKIVSGSTDKMVVIFKDVSGYFETIYTIDDVNEPIYGLLPLDEKRLIIQTATKLLCYKENTNAFEQENMFEMPSESGLKTMIKTMCVIKDNKIAFGGSTKKIYILNNDFSLNQTLIKHEGDVNAVIQLRDTNLASASQDHSIIIWKLTKDMKYQIHYVIADYNHGLYSLIELKDGQLCAACSFNNLVFWRCRNNYY